MSPEYCHRLSGVVLKEAEVITRRLLHLGSPVVPRYTIVPDVPPVETGGAGEAEVLHQFLHGAGFRSLPPAVDPGWSGGVVEAVPRRRAARKRAQVASVVAVVAELMRRVGARGTAVDFCGGCGYVGLALAALFRGWTIVVLDRKPLCGEMARRRAESARLRNVRVVVGRMEEFQERWDVGVALHACGGASDLVIEKALQMRAAFVVLPCCVGGLAAHKAQKRLRNLIEVKEGARSKQVGENDEATLGRWKTPRGSALRDVLEDDEEYLLLARAADYSEGQTGYDGWRSAAKAIIEQDRAVWAKDAGWEVRLSKMKPLECSPKNDIIIAWPGEWSAGVWMEDAEVNQALENIANASVLRNFDAYKVDEVMQDIQQRVLCRDGGEDCRFAEREGTRQRKIVHAVAESLGLYHRTIGKGESRAVLVRKTETWPLYFDGYIGYGGQSVEAMSAAFLSQVPEHALRRRLLVRGSPHHITILSPKDLRSLPPELRRNSYKLLRTAADALRGSLPVSIGLGKVSEKDRSPDRKGSQNDAYFVVIDWPEVQWLRKNLGLRPTDLHITLGFTYKDIHNTCKNCTTLISFTCDQT